MRRAARFIVPCLFLLFSVISLFPSESSGDGLTGEVVDVRGPSFMRLRDGAWKDAPKGAKVSPGERLKTGESTLAVIEMDGIGRFVIGPGSEIELGRDPGDFKSTIASGAVWLQSNLTKGAHTDIITPLVVAGVRGTKFSVFNGRGTKDVCVCTCIGEVEATLADGKKYKVGKGMILAILGDAAAPDKAESALPILEKKPAGFDFCFTCHTPGGKSMLKERPDQAKR